MVQRKEILYNEHDRSQVQEVLKKRKRRKRKKRLRRLSVLVILGLIIAYFVTDVSKIKSITIEGTKRLTQEQLLEAISIKEKESYTLFNSEVTTQKEVAEVAGVKKATVSKNLSGEVVITIEETNVIAYAKKDVGIYTIDEQGNLASTDDEEIKRDVLRVPEIMGMNEEQLQNFGKQYCQLPSQVQTQISEIVHFPGKADPNRFQMNMSDGIVVYSRTEDVVEQLEGNKYETIVKRSEGFKYLNLLGDKAYASKEKLAE